MSDEPVMRPPPTTAGAYHEIQREVDQHFGGEWERFLKALSNPGEVLHFVLWQHCGGEREKFESWATDKKLPPDWVPRFYGMLTTDGQLPPPPADPDAS